MIRTSLTDKLVAYFVILSITAVGIVGYFSYKTSRQALLQRTFDQLTSVRVVKKKEVENFFRDRINDIEFLSQLDETILTFNYLNNMNISINQPAAWEFFHNNTWRGIFFYRKYISNSRYYNKIIFIPLNSNENSIIIKKTNINTVLAPFICDSDVERFKNQILNDKKIVYKEFPDYSTGKNKIYLAAPITILNTMSGVLILEINTEPLNSIMLENNPKNGLGNSGESYLIGRDYLMRTKSRFIKNSILKTNVKTEGAQKAVNEKEGTSVYLDYRNIEVLGSFGRITATGLNWFILAEIDFEEANAPIYSMRNSILAITIFISAFVFILTYIFSKKITIPVLKLAKAALKVANGNYEEHVKVKSKDEIGTLTSSFNFMSRKLKTQEEELKKERLKRSSASIDAMENERKRLSQELHDGLGQTLISMKLKLENIDANKPDRTTQITKEVKKSIDGTIEEIRHISNNLMPSVLNEFGIVNAIRNLCEDLNEFSQINIEFVHDFFLENPDNRLQIYLFRIAQEALNNVIQHSNATIAKVELKTENNSIFLKINDNGKGFNTENITDGNGLFNIKERVNLLNGDCKINSVDNFGTVIDITIRNI